MTVQGEGMGRGPNRCFFKELRRNLDHLVDSKKTSSSNPIENPYRNHDVKLVIIATIECSHLLKYFWGALATAVARWTRVGTASRPPDAETEVVKERRVSGYGAAKVHSSYILYLESDKLDIFSGWILLVPLRTMDLVHFLVGWTTEEWKRGYVS